jgi:hypothetical protein
VTVIAHSQNVTEISRMINDASETTESHSWTPSELHGRPVGVDEADQLGCQ